MGTLVSAAAALLVEHDQESPSLSAAAARLVEHDNHPMYFFLRVAPSSVPAKPRRFVHQICTQKKPLQRPTPPVSRWDDCSAFFQRLLAATLVGLRSIWLRLFRLNFSASRHAVGNYSFTQDLNSTATD